jgi:Lon protease-like protein
MAVQDWRKARGHMEREAIAALAELVAAEDGALPLREAATLAIVTAHQVPELVEMGAFTEGDFDEDAMNAMAVVVDIAAGWDDEAESITEYVEGLDEHDLMRLARAAKTWAGAVWAQMVPLSEAEKEATLASLKRD